ncbi:MBL fold metallo-hydrolase [Streptomyces brasiliensis]|uniref:MBL fold metallo-hydrolase n=1 Tax=Streptomyces brasiliensis TaxID=1954 RepID=A0A917NWK7_9ACTN|nr:MBL fold metallo-hydrolase [Streptomyces brasiliensis]
MSARQTSPSPARQVDWVSSGAFRVAPDVYRIPLPLPEDGLRAVNTYALIQDDGVVMVDAGWALQVSRDQLRAGLGQLGAHLGDIKRFLVTHAHRDHYTQAIALRQEFGTRVSIGLGEQPTIGSVIRSPGTGIEAHLPRLRRAGAHSLVAALPGWLQNAPSVATDDSIYEEPDDWLTDRVEIEVGDRRLTALATPGHTAGHMVFVDPSLGVLFGGDHVLPHITPSIGFEPVPTELPLRDYLASLVMLLDLPDMRLLPAHGLPSPSTHTRVRELLSHHEHRLEECRQAVAAGGRTAWDVAQALPWTSRRRRFADLDMFNQVLAVCESAAHLDLLVHRSDLGATTVKGVTHYLPGP